MDLKTPSKNALVLLLMSLMLSNIMCRSDIGRDMILRITLNASSKPSVCPLP